MLSYKYNSIVEQQLPYICFKICYSFVKKVLLAVTYSLYYLMYHKDCYLKVLLHKHVHEFDLSSL